MSMLSTDLKQGFRLYRRFIPGEFIIAFGDTSQGGEDSNFVVYMSKTYGDIPMVLQMQGVAAEMTPYLRDSLNWLYGKTKGVKPLVALERNNGGSSEMLDLVKYNEGKYRVYYMKDPQGESDPNKPGFITSDVTRPRMLGDWLIAYESREIKIYDAVIQEQHQTFIVNKHGKPEAAPNTHDDAVMACAGAYQLYKTENPLVKRSRNQEHRKLKLEVGGR